MRWDRHTFTALGGIAALLIASALLLEDAHALFTPVIGMVGGIAAPAMASLERLKQRKEVAVPYGMLDLPETDIYGPEYRALPPAEHMVLVAWYWDDGQKQIASLDDGFVFVRLGCQRGVLHVHPNLARVRHVVLRTDDAVVAPVCCCCASQAFASTRVRSCGSSWGSARGRWVSPHGRPAPVKMTRSAYTPYFERSRTSRIVACPGMEVSSWISLKSSSQIVDINWFSI